MIQRSIYIGTNGNATGKRMVALGMMELAARRFGRVAFFRPVVRVGPDEDQSIRMMRSRYGIVTPSDEMFGVTRTQARQLLADDRYSNLIQLIQQRFKTLEAKADFVVVEGTSYQGLAPELEFELNADIAANIGSRVLSVYAMGDRSVDECVQSVLIGNESFVDRGAQLIATIINQVPDDQSTALNAAIKTSKLDSKAPLYFLPDEPLLRQPTVREIQFGIGAKQVSGDESSLDREVAVRKVAAMQLPGFLERLSNAALVMTPGDRSDILVGCVLACSQPDGPSPAAVVLTGGILPPPSIRRLVENANALPILVAIEDTYTVASKAAEVRAEIGDHSPRKIESAIGVFERHVDTDSLADRLQAPIVPRITPMLFEHSLIQRARQQRVKIVLPEATEPRILQAVDVLRRRDVTDVVLLGDPNLIAAAAARAGVMLPNDGLEIIDPATSPLRNSFASEYYQLRKHKGVTTDIANDRMIDVTYFGTMLVHRGLAGGLVSGAIHTTANTIRPAFEFIRTRPDVNVVSSVFLMCLKNGVLVYGDCAVIPNPTAEQLTEIAISSAETAVQFGIEPRIAMLSYSTGESGHGEDVDKVREATAMVRKRRPDLLVEGPLQYDAAVDPDVAATKMPGNPVAGQATVLVFPDLNTGNNLYKAVQRSAGAIAIGPVLQGLNKPVNDLSRGCTVTDIVNTVAITAIQAQTVAS
ncbi:phosphate acetyltransferase [Rhodopirellula europaea]|uniref:Phosphate acetyltransferase n=1 Tax=Rhodopirellula europaea SH398 TaxID=1263868 RepID=M5S6T7_9BACT|nr:phosphate acetyltransferase [Rhodopirellula europaea]EMI23362.1 phosphate acetyltransferase [Rhodopirellula europaea SH398]